MFNRGSHIDILVLSTFITDFSILTLMVAGILRWRKIRGRGGIWWVLYTQASIHHLADNVRQPDLMTHY
jgi:hypothetical protein